MTAPAIPPSVAIGLWYRLRRMPEPDRVLRFSNEIQRTLQTGAVPEPDRAELSCLEIPTLAHGALRRAGFTFIDEVEGLREEELCRIPRIGPVCAALIRQAVALWRQQRVPAVAPQQVFSPADVMDVCDAPLLEKQLAGLEATFNVWTEDRERLAAVLMHAADLADVCGSAHLRALATALIELPALPQEAL